MGRLHTHNHGKSHSIRPIDPKKPEWVKQSNEEVEGLIIKYAKEGMTSSQIGLKLRDQHAIPLVKPIINKSITDVLKENGIANSRSDFAGTPILYKVPFHSA